MSISSPLHGLDTVLVCMLFRYLYVYLQYVRPTCTIWLWKLFLPPHVTITFSGLVCKNSSIGPPSRWFWPFPCLRVLWRFVCLQYVQPICMIWSWKYFVATPSYALSPTALVIFMAILYVVNSHGLVLCGHSSPTHTNTKMVILCKLLSISLQKSRSRLVG